MPINALFQKKQTTEQKHTKTPKGLQLKEERHHDTKQEPVFQMGQCCGYCGWGTCPLGHMLINNEITKVKNLKTSPTKYSLCEHPPSKPHK